MIGFGNSRPPSRKSCAMPPWGPTPVPARRNLKKTRKRRVPWKKTRRSGFSRRLTVGQRQRQKRRLAETLDRVARRGTGVRTEDALRRRIRGPRASAIRAAEGILGPVAARQIRQHGRVVPGNRIRPGVLDREVFYRQLEAMHVRLHAGFACAVLHGDEVRNRDCRQDPDDHDDDHELDEREAFRVAHVLHLLSVPASLAHSYILIASSGDQSNGHATESSAPQGMSSQALPVGVLWGRGAENTGFARNARSDPSILHIA